MTRRASAAVGATCSSCSAKILWVTTERGRAMPVDRAPGVEGNLELESRPYPLGPLARVVGRKDDGVRRYTSHFATCPNRDEHRRARA